MKSKLFILCLFSFYLATAQSKQFSGKILDKNTQQSIPFAHINLISESGTGYISDLEGNFSFKALPDLAGTLLVRISCIGYVSQTIRLTGRNQTVFLSESATALKGLVITGLDEA